MNNQSKDIYFDIISLGLLLVLVVIMTSCSFGAPNRRLEDRRSTKECTLEFYNNGMPADLSYKFCRDLNQ